jgi:glycerol uptake facilitator-like aquaporin
MNINILTNKFFIEFIGNFILILVILTTENYFTISLVLVTCVYLGGPLTTGNPAVLYSLYKANKINSQEFFFYLIAELLGCALGYEIYHRLLRKY